MYVYPAGSRVAILFDVHSRRLSNAAGFGSINSHPFASTYLKVHYFVWLSADE